MTITTRAAFVAGALAPRMASAHAELTEDEAQTLADTRAVCTDEPPG